MTTAATHLSVQHRMTVGKVELPAFVQMALKTDVGRLFGIDDGVMRATALIMDAAGPMAGLAADILCIVAFGFQPRVRSGFEIACYLGVTFRAGFGTNKLRALNVRRRNDHAVHGAAGDHNDSDGEQQRHHPATPTQQACTHF